MTNKNSGTKFYEDEYGDIKNYNFEFDIDEADECFINGMGNIENEDECFTNGMGNIENEDCKEVYQKGFKDGYEKAKQEVLVYMKKNKCFIKCKHK